MKLLVTGATGFVGANLVRVLASQPDVAVIATDLTAPDAQVERLWARAQAQWRRLDVTDRAAVRALIEDEAITHILHAAALTPTGEQERAQATHIVDVNLGGAVNVLDAALQTPSVERLLLASSSGVYGAPRAGAAPVQREDDPLDLTNLYALTKYSVELLGRRYRQLTAKPIASLRFGPIYGPLERSSPTRPRLSQIGELYRALRRRQPVRVAGGEFLRDWTHVDDIAGAVWALLAAAEWQHDVYNVSCGEPIRFDEVVQAFAAHGLAATWIDDPAQADVAMTAGQARLPMDIGRLRADSAYQPRYAFAQGLDRMIEVNASLDQEHLN
jgi:nucleoside-diphosphate-sugar epimerase